MSTTDEILALLADGVGRSTGSIGDAVGVYDETKIAREMGNLRKAGRVQKDGDGMWRLLSKVEGCAVKALTINKDSAVKPVATWKPEPSDTTSLDEAVIDKALVKLEGKLKAKTVPAVVDYGVKHATLFKLAQLMDPSIAEVLKGISGDLTTMHDLRQRD